MIAIKTRPEGLEGPNTYLMRIAEAFGYSIGELTRQGFLDTYASHNSEFGQIARSRANHPSAWLSSGSRLCVECLKAGDFTSSSGWELRFAEACIKHGTWLIDRCQCGARLTPSRPVVAQCPACGGDLRRMTIAPAPTTVTTLAKLVVAATVAPTLGLPLVLPNSLADLRELNPSELYKLALSIGTYGDPRRPSIGKYSVMDDLSQSWSFSTLAAEVLGSWPEGFRRCLESVRKANDDGSSYQLSKVLGPLYRRIESDLTGPAFDFLREALREYLAEHWRASTRTSSRLDSIDYLQTRWLTPRAVTAAYGLSRAAMEDLIARGDLIADSRRTIGGRTRLVVDRESLIRLESNKDARWLDLKSAATLVGIGRARLARIFREVFPTAWRSQSNQWRIPRRDIDELLLKKPSSADGSASAINLAAVGGLIRCGSLSDAELTELLLRARKDSTFRYFGRDPRFKGVCAWLIPHVAKSATGIAGVEPRLLTVPQVAVRLGFKQEVAYFLVRENVLPVDPENNDAYRGALVSMENVERFEREFVSAAELAISLKRSPKKICDDLKRIDIWPAFDRSDGCRQILYRRSDVPDSFAPRKGGQQEMRRPQPTKSMVFDDRDIDVGRLSSKALRAGREAESHQRTASATNSKQLIDVWDQWQCWRRYRISELAHDEVTYRSICQFVLDHACFGYPELRSIFAKQGLVSSDDTESVRLYANGFVASFHSRPPSTITTIERKLDRIAASAPNRTKFKEVVDDQRVQRLLRHIRASLRSKEARKARSATRHRALSDLLSRCGTDVEGLRDRAILHILLAAEGMPLSALPNLRLMHLRRRGGRVHLRRDGYTWVSPAESVTAMESWLRQLGTRDRTAAIFVHIEDRKCTSRALSASDIRQIVASHAIEIGGPQLGQLRNSWPDGRRFGRPRKEQAISSPGIVERVEARRTAWRLAQQNSRR